MPSTTKHSQKETESEKKNKPDGAHPHPGQYEDDHFDDLIDATEEHANRKNG